VWRVLLATTVAGLVGTGGAEAQPLQQLDVAQRIERLDALLASPYGLAPLPDGLDSALLSSATARRVEAFRVFKSLPDEEQEAYEQDFAAPEDDYQCLLSERYPIRSCYTWDDQLEQAEFMLAQAEDGWDRIVDELGFWAPWRLGEDSQPEVGMDFYLGNTRSQGAAGYTAPIDYIPATPHHDCTSYIVIDDAYRIGEEMGRTIRHELCHATQLAMDCAETHSSMEATSVWLETALSDDLDRYFYWASAHFQSYPHRSIAWDGPDAFYKYGSSLFLRFVHEFLGAGDRGVVPRLWEATVQYEDRNEPDMLDAMLALARDQELSFGDVVREFGEWRYFLGARDDGAHLSLGAAMVGAEVKVEGQLSVADPNLLPHMESVAVHPLGYWYATIDLPAELPEGGELWVGGKRDSLEQWALVVWLVPEEGRAARLQTELGRRSGDPIRIPVDDLRDLKEVVLMVANTREDVDWDMAWLDRTTEVEVDMPRPPRIDSVTPAALQRGERQSLVIQGSGFGPSTSVAVLDDGVTVLGCERTGGGVLECVVQVAPDTPPGPRSLVVDNGPERPGPADRLDGALRVVPPSPAQPLGLHPDRAAPGQRLLVQLRGHGLTVPSELSFDCPELVLNEVLTASDDLLYLDVSVDPQAVPRTCDLSTEDSFGGTARLSGAFTVLAAAGGHEAGKVAADDNDGCALTPPTPAAGTFRSRLARLTSIVLRARGPAPTR